MSELSPMQVTEEKIDAYLQLLSRQGRAKSTTTHYHSLLCKWYESLPEDKLVMPDAADQWKSELKNKGLSDGTISSCSSAVNGFLGYLRDPQGCHIRRKQQEVEPKPETVLTWDDYRMLLSAAKVMGRKRPYLLIKTIVCVGIRTLEFQGLTVEGVRRGIIEVTGYGAQRMVPVPEPIRTDLLEFAEERGIKEGPIFITKDGGQLPHSLIWKEVKQICRQVGLPEEKGFPRSLYQLHKNTRKRFYTEFMEEAEERYSSLLLAEESMIGWKWNGKFQ